MVLDDRPVVVGFDGSGPAEAAVRAAAALFAGRRLIVASIWEPGMAMVSMSTADPFGMTAASMPTAEVVQQVDRTQEAHAAAIAEKGAALAEELGGRAEARALEDWGGVGRSITALAERQDAAAIVIGSRGLGRAKSRLMGSTSRQVLHETRRPVLVVRAQG